MDSLAHGVCWDGRWDSLPAGAVLNQIPKSQQQAEDHVADMTQFKNSGVIFIVTNIQQNHWIMFLGVRSYLANSRCQKSPWKAAGILCHAGRLPTLHFRTSPPLYRTTPCWNSLWKPTSTPHILENVTGRMFQMNPPGAQHGPSQGRTCSRRDLAAPPSSCSGDLCRSPLNVLQGQD